MPASTAVDRQSAVERFNSSVVLQLMMMATLSLAAMQMSSIALQIVMLWSFGDRRVSLEPGVEPPTGLAAGGTPVVPLPAEVSAPPSPVPPPLLSAEEDERVFLETVKRRMSIKTPLDTSFYRPFARAKPDFKRATTPNVTSLIFVAGAEGTGHHFITALMMRLFELMPMSLTQEQMFQALWWNPDGQDPAVFWGALESFMEWVQSARSFGKHPAFCARTCLRITGMKHCSWISGMQEQNLGRMLNGKGHNGTFQPIGQMFSYPFSRSWNETEDGTHYPKLADLQYLCDLAGLRLKVVVLYRDPVDAIMSMNNRGLPKIWRRAGRTFKLHKQVDLFLSQLDEMYSQLQLLRSEDYVVLNYTDLLVASQDYAAPLASFLELPVKNVARAFTLSIKAKPKKKNNATVPLTAEGAWSDDVRRSFIQSRLEDRLKSSTPPKCCDKWIQQMKRTNVAHMPQAPPRQQGPHWFSKWAARAEAPRRVEQISFTHVVNPFKPASGTDLEHQQAQKATLDSIAHAASLAGPQGIVVDVVCAVFPEDADVVAPWVESNGFKVVTFNASVMYALPQFKHPAKLPFLNMILYAGYLHGAGEYLVYSNVDIGVQPPFYITLARQLQVMPDVPISTIREEFEHVGATFNIENAIARRGSGLGHPGHDCWTFPRAWVPRLFIGFTVVGVSMIATDLMQALHAISGCRMSLLSPKLTFHFVEGDSVVRHPGNQRARNDKVWSGLYAAWNCAQFARNRRDVLAMHPEYNQCWFSQQAEWNLYSYQCESTINHLPFEYKLLWHNATIEHACAVRARPATLPVPRPLDLRPEAPAALEGAAARSHPIGACCTSLALPPPPTRRHPFLSNCNLPGICGKCRGGVNGTKRPTADLMTPEPCGFCRCGSDLQNEVYMTLQETPSQQQAVALGANAQTLQNDFD